MSNPSSPRKYEIRAIPTLLIIVDGKVLKTSVGVVKKEALLEQLDEVVKRKPQP